MKFDNAFFQEHQQTLLHLLNSPIGGLIRRGLWIPDRRPIVKVTPESYHVLLPNGKIKATIHSNKQHAQAIRRNYKPIWEAFHTWDMRIANRLLPALNVGFDSYSSQPDDTTGIDCYLYANTPTTNNNTTILYMGEVNSAVGGFCTTLIKFDFSSIPSGANSSAASLQLTITTDFCTNAPTMVFKHSLRAWSETQATWNVYTTGNSWGTVGARNASTDYGAQLASLVLGTSDTGAKTWTFSTSEMDKYFNGTYTNNGFIGFSTVDNNDGYEFGASGHATPGTRPKFDVTYGLPSGFFF